MVKANKKISAKAIVREIGKEKKRTSLLYHYFIETYRDAIIKETLATHACKCIVDNIMTPKEVKNWLDEFYAVDSTNDKALRKLWWSDSPPSSNNLKFVCIEIAEKELNTAYNYVKPVKKGVNLAKATRRELERQYQFHLAIRQQFQLNLTHKIVIIRMLIEIIIMVNTSFADSEQSRHRIKTWYLTWLKQNEEVKHTSEIDEFNQALGLTDFLKRTSVYEAEELIAMNTYLKRHQP